MSSLNSFRVRDLIRAVRYCKTPSEEQALVNRERASIREAMKDGSPYNRTRNMLKLMYLTMIGYSTRFAQIEVVNLLAQQDFAGKRTGYLCLPIMLEEEDEVLTLVENHMKTDMNNESVYVQGVALNAAANTASTDMSRDIFQEVIKLMPSFNSYVRKKACLSALRIVRKYPESIEYFLESLATLFDERYNSSLMCALALANACLQTPQGAPFLPRFRSCAPAAVRALRNLVATTRVTDSTIGMVSDPFLQVKILEFMRIVGRDDLEVAELFHDILTCVIMQTEGDNNSVRYECARTIQVVGTDANLRQSAIIQMSKLLGTRNNNYSYVALGSLSRFAAAADQRVVQEHQSLILDCLKSPDPSVQEQALDLVAELVSSHNVRLLMPDLIDFLKAAEGDIKERTTLHVCSIINEKSPTEEWRVDASLKALRVGKRYVPLPFAFDLIGLLSRQERDVQAKATCVLWTELSGSHDGEIALKEALLVTAVWTIGEYLHELLAKKDEVSSADAMKSVVDATLSTNSKKVKLYGITAMTKIAARYPDTQPPALHALELISSSLDCELQQRSTEYLMLLKKFPEEAAFCFGPMPAISATESPPSPLATPVPVLPSSQLNTLLDDLFGGEPTESSISEASTSMRCDGSLPPGADFSASFSASMTDNVIQTSIRLRSTVTALIEVVAFEAAAPRSCTITLGPAVREVAPYSEVVQTGTVTVGPECKNPRRLMLRLKVRYVVDGEEREYRTEVSGSL